MIPTCYITPAMTTTHDIPDDIREALKIREDLDGVSGELLGYKKSAAWVFEGFDSIISLGVLWGAGLGIMWFMYLIGATRATPMFPTTRIKGRF